jgi:pimeloyl-ACP methyl ester carboxylesterase
VPFFFLHGFLGTGANWRGIASAFENDFVTVCPDAVNHGRSGRRGEMSYPAMAQDLLDTADYLAAETPFIVLGHSMGGKTAMEAAISRPDRIKALVVADIAPRTYPAFFTPYLKALREVKPENFNNRREVMDFLADAIPERMIRSFFLKNIEYSGDSFKWRVDLPALSEGYEQVRGGLSDGRVYSGPALFLQGEKSDYITPQDRDMILKLFPKAEFAVVKSAGHWIHDDNPAGVVEAIKNFLSEFT